MTESGALFTIDHADSTPPFEQLRMQVIEALRMGALVPGTRLPTVRTLAAELGLAPNTVARSYRELERDEVIETRGRNGTFVSATGDAATRQTQLAAAAYAERVRQLGVSTEDAVSAVLAALGAS
ncbi:GntR family transcriptional regulator [Luethyella okanaganae]|uniref:GntR family transcriptional regulator n=1 Tax=Luethyella okanaganae TaxID=69372 RepID=A0ABW1VHG4_9MICO